MARDKQLLGLAFDFNNAPQEVKDAAEKHRLNYMRNEKAIKQMDLWSKELQSSKFDFSRSGIEFEKALKSWDPDGLKNAKLEDLERGE